MKDTSGNPSLQCDNCHKNVKTLRKISGKMVCSSCSNLIENSERHFKKVFGDRKGSYWKGLKKLGLDTVDMVVSADPEWLRLALGNSTFIRIREKVIRAGICQGRLLCK